MGLKRKILYIVTNSNLGGISKYLIELAKDVPQDFMPYFIMGSEGYLSEELRKLGIKDEQMFFVPMTNSLVNLAQHFKSTVEVLKIVRLINPDLIHCNATTAAIIGAFCAGVTKIPTVYTVHGWPFTYGIVLWTQVFYKIIEFFMCKVYKKIICVSEYDRQIGIKALPMYKNKMLAIHNGINDIPEEYIKKEFSKDELKIVMIARFCPQKDHYTLIAAVSDLVKEGYNVKLDLYGYGPETDKFMQYLKQQNCEFIKYKGEISDVTPILKDYDVYALISNWEGLPIGIIEAMRAGLPVLVTDVGGNSECVENNGYIVKRQDVSDCKKQIKALWDNRNNLAMLGQNSRKLYEEEFMSKIMTEKTFEEYNI